MMIFSPLSTVNGVIADVTFEQLSNVTFDEAMVFQQDDPATRLNTSTLVNDEFDIAVNCNGFVAES
jgi:hypothetical protein